jgi:outer membrane lipoprotein LolB
MSVLGQFSCFFSKILGLLFAINLIAGCATNTPARGIFETENSTSETTTTITNYQGRLSLRIASDPPQSLYAAFNLNGDALTGDLTLNSPLGNSLAKLSWTSQSAVLTANNETKEYPSTRALIENVTGTTIPLEALFDWMAGKDSVAEGWEVDLSDMKSPSNDIQATQRFVAKRLSPLPTAELRIAIDK